MKTSKYPIALLMLILIFPLCVQGQMGKPNTGTALIEDAYTGKWNFEAPEAPEGSTEGAIEIKADRVIMKFDNVMEYTSDWIKFRNDSIIFQTAFDAAIVVFSVRIVDKHNLNGKAVWEGGETPFIVTKNLGIKL
jgi:hypothetical protein